VVCCGRRGATRSDQDRCLSPSEWTTMPGPGPRAHPSARTIPADQIPRWPMADPIRFVLDQGGVDERAGLDRVGPWRRPDQLVPDLGRGPSRAGRARGGPRQRVSQRAALDACWTTAAARPCSFWTMGAGPTHLGHGVGPRRLGPMHRTWLVTDHDVSDQIRVGPRPPGPACDRPRPRGPSRRTEARDGPRRPGPVPCWTATAGPAEERARAGPRRPDQGATVATPSDHRSGPETGRGSLGQRPGPGPTPARRNRTSSHPGPDRPRQLQRRYEPRPGRRTLTLAGGQCR
jgi:hypothetical protein